MRFQSPKLHAAIGMLCGFIAFFYLVSSTRVTDDVVIHIDRALERFYKNLELLKDFQTSEFKTVKMHSLTKYAECFKENGAPANYTTEHFERQHKTDVKETYRATNRNAFIGQVLRLVDHRLHLARESRQTKSGPLAPPKPGGELQGPSVTLSGGSHQSFRVFTTTAQELSHKGLQRCLGDWLLRKTTDERGYVPGPQAVLHLITT